MNLQNKVAIVTGASSGIGAEIAIKFSKEGAKVAIVGRNEKKLKEIFEKCEKFGGEPLMIIADVTKDEDVKRIVKDTVNRFGTLDVLINNTGIASSVNIMAENALQVFDQTMDINLRSAVNLTNTAAPHLVASKGNIINISSIASSIVLAPNTFTYCTSKAALDHFTRCVSLDFSSKGVRCNVVNPGPVKTGILENAGVNEVHQEAEWQRMKQATALDRLSEPEETADLVSFLASGKARGITGSSFVTDNGLILKGSLKV